MQVLTPDDLEPLLARLSQLEASNAALTQTLTDTRRAIPGKWLITTEARLLFVGRGGRPVHRHTFQTMINKWLENGTLQHGVSYLRSGQVQFISIEFLTQTTGKGYLRKAG